ncbi:hypothetical protein C5167_028007 [Papaver somniferum]|uniref:probable carboxylesterase 6 n=1 Tax=Papaver somniferum TaxID=3469 RepID=UPI000E6F4BEE|nr:probable carboxylesterase 6 [Papaver somniferum]RZC92116.1 hypothetical protein C5167_028007 [Papaver somniferum]
MSIIAESPKYLQIFSDGVVKRFAPPIVDASSELTYGFRSKDVIIDPSKPISGRIFFPDTKDSTAQLPVLVYFHGGGFCIGSTTWCGYHHFLGDLSVECRCIVLSVDYRLAPENKLPIAYEDCFASLKWLSMKSHSDPWLSGADLSRVFLSGDSAGGNITHHVGIRALQDNECCVKILGLIPIHPYFGSEKRTEKEMAEGEDAEQEVKSNDMFWRLSLPEGSNRDHYACNFENLELSEAEWSKFPKAVVYVAGLDFLKERGVKYANYLKNKGVKVELIEAENEKHVYHVFLPEAESTRLLQRQMNAFINQP